MNFPLMLRERTCIFKIILPTCRVKEEGISVGIESHHLSNIKTEVLFITRTFGQQR